MFIALDERIILMAEYREFICTRIGIGPKCGFEVRAETEAEVMKHADMHVAKPILWKRLNPVCQKKLERALNP